MEKKYVIGFIYESKEVFYKRIDGKEVEFVGIRSMAHHFDNEEDAQFTLSFLKSNGYDCWVESFYVIKKIN